MADNPETKPVRSSLRWYCKVLALIFGPLFVLGPVAGAALFLLFQPGEWATYCLAPFFLFCAGLFAYLMAETYSWIELEGDTIRARNFWTGRISTRRVSEVRDFSPPEAPAFAIWFHKGRRLGLVRRDMTDSDGFIEAVTAKVLEHRRASTPSPPPPADAELTFELSDRLALEAASRHFMRTSGRGQLLGAAVTAAGFALLLAIGFMSSLLPFLVPGGLLVLFLVSWRSSRRGATAPLERLHDRSCTVRFDEEGISTETALGSSRVRWEAVAKLWRFPKVWLLVYLNGTMNVVPPELISPELRNFIVRQVELSGGRAR